MRGRPGGGSRAPGAPFRRSRCTGAARARSQAVDPVAEDPLIGPPELSGAGEDAAAVDPDREVERRRRTRARAARSRACSRRRATPGRAVENVSEIPAAAPARLEGRGRVGRERGVRLGRAGSPRGRESSRRGSCESRTKPARWRRQYSRRFTVPRRLCSRSWRLLVAPSTPARTFGVAAASITTSAAGRVSKSLASADVGVEEADAEGAEGARGSARCRGGSGCRRRRSGR